MRDCGLATAHKERLQKHRPGIKSIFVQVYYEQDISRYINLQAVTLRESSSRTSATDPRQIEGTKRQGNISYSLLISLPNIDFLAQSNATRTLFLKANRFEM